MKILVPIDFTDVTEHAYHYALQLPFAREIILFHVVDSIKKEAEALKQLEKIKTKVNVPSSITVSLRVEEGSIFELIGDTALQIGADLIVMATHGIKGLQHIIGSRAMKVITHSKTPYIVIQKKPYRPLKKMLVPVDFTREVKQVIPAVLQFAKLFNASIALLKQMNDDTFIQNRINHNLNYFESVLNDEKVAYTIIEKEFSLDDKYEVVTEQAAATDADIIVTTIDPELGLTDYIMGVEEQKIVANSLQLPVLCINIKHFMVASDVFGITTG
jgi:nucleotide-binding universal stress UspA family protein